MAKIPSIARRVALFLLGGALVIAALLWHGHVTRRACQRDWQAHKAMLHAWADAEQHEWQRKIAAREADDAAYRDAARRCALRLTGKPDDTPYDAAFVGLTMAEQFACFSFRRLRLTVDY